jgi:hypothetical protein
MLADFPFQFLSKPQRNNFYSPVVSGKFFTLSTQKIPSIHSLNTVMNSKFFKQHFIFIGLILIVLLTGCRKHYRCKVCPGNKAPIAEAGNDTILTLPVNSLILDGSASYDLDGTIASYRWSKRVGSSSYQISGVESVKPEVSKLVEGEYLFELEVRDNTGQPAKDLVVVRVVR